MNNSELSLRKVRKNDLKIIFDLSNDKQARSNSFQTGIITLSNHTEWFNKILHDKEHLLLLARSKEQVVGLIRFHIKNNNALISINVSKKFRGQGWGKIMIEESIIWIRNKYPSVKTIQAQIRVRNLISITLFAKCNFILHKKIKIHNKNAFLYEFRL